MQACWTSDEDDGDSGGSDNAGGGSDNADGGGDGGSGGNEGNSGEDSDEAAGLSAVNAASVTLLIMALSISVMLVR